MIEIIVLVLLSKDIGKIAISKGLPPFKWKVYLIIGWVITEIAGIGIGFMIFGQKNLISAVLIGLVFAVTSYYALRSMLLRLPDKDQDDIDQIGGL